MAKKIKQLEVSDYLGIEQATYSGYETEAGNLQFRTVIKIAEALKCSIPFLTDIYSSNYIEEEWNAE